MANLRFYRDSLKFIGAIVFCFLYIPHLIVYAFSSKEKREVIYSDLFRMKDQIHIHIKGSLLLLFFLHNNSYYRSLFYYRIGPIKSLLIGWYRPGDKYFIIPKSTKIGKNFCFAHPYSTILNAESIGDNFSCIHLTTIGKHDGKRPVIGNNVTLGANVNIIGDVKIGNNVIVGAGSVVVKSVPDNCVVAGVPAKVIKTLDNQQTADDKAIPVNTGII
ncbi:MAG: serine acetyltransferase [Muribaculaceae bacterium]|nr:serine acetyltransferase [Muribaculaceae bacterium]MDE6027622.1 serine acetyltransferase [Muribaculaceae bacterium]